MKKGIISYPYESEVHLQLCYPPADAAPDAVAKWNRAKVVKTLRGMFTYPALRSKVQRTGEILVIHRRGVVTQGQLSLTKTVCKSVNAFCRTQCDFLKISFRTWTLHQSYPFGDEISIQHQIILCNSTVAWENWEKPAPRKEQTKSIIQHYALISATMPNCKTSRW